jgi:hypothetical protein
MPSTFRSFRHALLGAGLLATIGSLATVGPAHAGPSIAIAVSESPANMQTLLNTSTTSGIANYSFTTTDFTGTITAVGSPILPQPTLNTSSIDARTTTTRDNTLYIYITELGLSTPHGVNKFLSGFTSNFFTGGAVSVIENTYVSTTNALWGGTLLATHTFTPSGLGSASELDTTPSLGSLYSETAEFIVHIRGTGSVNDTINISDPVPEPMSVALLGAGMFGLGFVRRRKTQPVRSGV